MKTSRQRLAMMALVLCSLTANAHDFKVGKIFYEIISEGVSLLTENGRIALILPHEFKESILAHAATVNLCAHRITNVFPRFHKP